MIDGERVVAMGLIDVAVLLRVCFESKNNTIMKNELFPALPAITSSSESSRVQKKPRSLKVLRITHASTGSIRE
jgi:hypothetical protein